MRRSIASLAWVTIVLSSCVGVPEDEGQLSEAVVVGGTCRIDKVRSPAGGVGPGGCVPGLPAVWLDDRGDEHYGPSEQPVSDEGDAGDCVAKPGDNGHCDTAERVGSDDGGEASLTYTWSASGPAAVTFTSNGTNAAKSSMAMFSASGSYSLSVTVRDQSTLTATSSVTVSV